MVQLFLVMSAKMYSTLTVVGDMAICILYGTFLPCRLQVFPCRKSRPGKGSYNASVVSVAVLHLYMQAGAANSLVTNAAVVICRVQLP